MSRIELISIETGSGRSSVPEWTDALSTRIGQVPLSSWDQAHTNCLPVGQQEFGGRIEFGMLRDTILAKVTTSSPHHLTFSPRQQARPAARGVDVPNERQLPCGAAGLLLHASSGRLLPGRHWFAVPYLILQPS